jgi:hypothetical protein
MSLGDSIFLSALVLGLVGLYAATKDRWKWKEIAKWLVGLPVTLGIVGSLLFWAHSVYEKRPVKQVEFEKINLDATPSDIKFIKGEPIAKHSSNTRWIFDAHSGAAEPGDAVVIVQFKDGKVRHVTFWSNERQIVTPVLLGISKGSSYEAVIDALGQPNFTSASKDGLRRLLSFEKYRVFFELERGQVQNYGIFNPTQGPLKFIEEPASTEPSKSASTR